MVGVSGDKAEAQLRFVEKYQLTFPIIPDRQKVVIKHYGAGAVLGLAAKRSTFLIDPDGKIAHVWPNVRIQGHAAEVVETIRGLSS